MYPACLLQLGHLQAYLAQALVMPPGENLYYLLPQGNSRTDYYMTTKALKKDKGLGRTNLIFTSSPIQILKVSVFCSLAVRYPLLSHGCHPEFIWIAVYCKSYNYLYS